MDVLQVAQGDGPPGSMGERDPGRPATIPATRLLSWNRLDLAFKLHFLDSIADHPSAFSERLYDEHVRALTEEAGDPGASELPRSRSRLAETFRHLGTPGTPEPQARLAADGSLLTDADEVACSIVLGRPVTAIPTGERPATYDYRFFERHGVDREHLDAAVLRFIERAPDCYVALIWPAAQGSDDEIAAILGPVVYRKAVALDPNGAHNLLTQVYAGEAWLGDPAQNHPGVRNKLIPCFGRGGPLRVFVVQRSNLEEVLATKQAVRDRFGLGKHSIHITDTHEEAVMVARLLLNDRGVQFLNAARPTRFASTLRMAKGFEDYLRRKGIPADRALVDSGMVLAVHGLREAQDVDFISPEEVDDEGLFSRHGPGAHGLPIGELLHDPRNHFHYWGLRFVSLEQVARMKRRRKVGRDLDDLGLVGPVLAGKSSHPRLLRTVNHLRFVAAKARRRAIQATRRLGLYDVLKSARERVRRRRS